MLYIRVAAWNISSVADSRLLLNTPWDTDELLQGSIIFLSETRCRDDISGWFTRHTVWQIPAETGRPGQGLVMAVPESEWYCAEVVQQQHDIIGVVLRDGKGPRWP